jgi:long-subunit acyl-CoA synthetase (AMP-forming)
MVVGDAKPYIAALITLDVEALPGLAGTARQARPTPRWRSGPTIRSSSAIQEAVDEANKAVSNAEAIKKFEILDVDWTEEGGQLTPVAEAQAQRGDGRVRRSGRGALLLDPRANARRDLLIRRAFACRRPHRVSRRRR